MSKPYRVVRVSYSEELQEESQLWLSRIIEKALLEQLAKDNYKVQALLLNNK